MTVSTRGNSPGSGARLAWLLGLPRLRGRGKKTAQGLIEGERLVDRAFRRLGLVRLSHAERIAKEPEFTPKAISKAYWVLAEYRDDWDDADETLRNIYRIMTEG